MDMHLFIPAFAFVMQLVSIYFAFRLWSYTGKHVIAVVILLIVSLMAFRRAVSLIRFFIEGTIRTDLIAEATASVISCLLLFAIIYVTRLILRERANQEAVVSAEVRYRTLFDQSPDGVLLIDSHGTIVDFNDQVCLQLGYTRDEFRNLRIADIDPVESVDEIRTRFEDVARKGRAEFEVTHKTKNGEHRNVYVMTQMLNLSGQIFYHTIWRDITERKRVEVALQESNAKLQTLIRALPDAVFFKDTSCRYLLVNRVFEDMMGAGQAMFIGKTDEDFMPTDLAEGCRRSDEALMKSGRPVNVEDTIIGLDGKTIYLDSVKAPIYDSHGVLLGVVGVSRDVTARKRAEDDLKQSEQFNRNILDTVDEGFIVVDRDYRILTANKAYCDQVGGECEAIIGSHCYEISHKASRPCYEEGEDCATRHVFNTGDPHSSLHKHTDAKGTVIYVETKGFPIKDSFGTVTSVIETVNNITERYLLEEERLKTQKLESIGTLAGGIAHDFNNLLQGIFGYISMAKVTHDQKEKSLDMLEQAEKALHQSVNLTNQLLTFSKGGKPVRKRIDLRPVIENSTKFMLSGSRSDFQMNIPVDLWQTEADAGQVGQVIQNIVLNADQSMPAGGSVIVTAKNVSTGNAFHPPGLTAGNYILISIQDTGIGISEQHLLKIFDPYFTTKEKGSGLGLATSYAIVRNHGGMIDIITKPGEGSTFMIYLPATTTEHQALNKAIPTDSSPARMARVLVMDDEEIIRKLSRELLLTLGQEAEVAKDGSEAVEMYKCAMAAGKPFDIVILDLTIRGGMGGLETVQKLREVDPAVKAVVSSGYSDDSSIANHRSYGFKAYLKKPYDITALRDTLNSLMARQH